MNSIHLFLSEWPPGNYLTFLFLDSDAIIPYPLTFLTATFLPCPGGPFTSSGNNMRPEKTEPKAPSPITLSGLKSSVHLLISGKGKETGLPSAKAACTDASICVGDT